MAKSFEITVALALCFVAFVSYAHCAELHVQGKVYCDTCRVQFVTKVTEYIEGAQVRLECKNREGGRLNYSKEGVTDATGTYMIVVEDDHEEDICEVTLLKSPVANCNQIVSGRDRARVVLTENSGVTAQLRYANHLGFLKTEALPTCAGVLRELGFFPIV